MIVVVDGDAILCHPQQRVQTPSCDATVADDSTVS